MFFTRLNPNNPIWRSLNDVQHEVNRIFDRWGHHPFGLGEFPLVNLREEEDALHLEAELPGLALDDLEIFVTGSTQLTLKGERKPPALGKAIAHRQERGYGKFTRTLTLPYAVNDGAIDARFENGVLKIHMPKHEAAKPRKIAIKG